MVEDSTTAKLAKLARIKIEKELETRMRSDITQFLSWLDVLNEVDLVDVAPMTAVHHVPLPMRPDEVTMGNERSDILANAPSTLDGFFVVPKVVE